MTFGCFACFAHCAIQKETLQEIHVGVCTNDFAGRSQANKAMTRGYWWLYIKDQAAITQMGSLLEAR